MVLLILGSALGVFVLGLAIAWGVVDARMSAPASLEFDAPDHEREHARAI